MSWSLIHYVLTAAFRDRVITALMVVIILGASLSVFFGSAAITEKDQFTAVFAAGGLRIAGAFGLVLFVVFFMRRSFESKDVEFLLSRPLGRVQFLLSYAVAFWVLALLMTLAQGVALYILSPHLFGAGHVLWLASIAAENIIMVSMGLFFAMFLTSAATAAIATFGFYVLARMMGQILGIISSTFSGSDMPGLEMAIQMISAITPRLDLMGQTSWLVYGVEADVDFGFVFMQCAVFTALVLLASLLDLVRRQF